MESSSRNFTTNCLVGARMKNNPMIIGWNTFNKIIAKAKIDKKNEKNSNSKL